jgi:hypothetical protein
MEKFFMFYEGHNMTKGLSKATDKNKFYMGTVVYTSSFLRILSLPSATPP